MAAPNSDTAAIALGSNLGESQGILERALARLEREPELTVQQRSRWYRTVPIGPPQPAFVNGSALLASTLPPKALLERLLAVETEFGRQRQQRWGPRVLDLDLILFGQAIAATPQLQLPHPRLSERAFVLVPLAEIAPHWQHPVSGQTMASLAQALDWSGVCPL
jgi:2-amino-4-hydroxy-6-hydroxymethyldihydropteridine diphosphokinase